MNTYFASGEGNQTRRDNPGASTGEDCQEPAMTENLSTTSVASLPALGAPPLIKGEDTAAYDDLVGRIRAVLRPADVIEEIWARDVADLAWEVFRLRRLKASLMRACAYEGMEQVLDPLIPACIDEHDEKDGE